MLPTLPSPRITPTAVLLGICLTLSPCLAQESGIEKPVAKAKIPVEQQARFDAFSKKFSGAKLRGSFTVDGKPLNDLADEAYEIVRARKMPQGDSWSLESRIKYGKFDLVVPVLLDVKWAGDTPVLTLDDLTIPGLGTFSARVVLHRDKYAGTWQHGKVGGHLFGRIEVPKRDGQSAKSADRPSPTK